jgi:Fe-S-cluster containining protein
MKSIELPVIQNSNESNNPCFSCGACCKNTWFDHISAKELKLFMKNATDVNQINHATSYASRADLSDRHDDPFRLDGINYVQNPQGDFTVSLKGACSEFGTDGKCQIYDQRPQICADMKVGGDSCNDRRKGVGLPAIRPDGTLIPVETFRQRVEKVATKFVIKVLPVGFGGGL